MNEIIHRVESKSGFYAQAEYRKSEFNLFAGVGTEKVNYGTINDKHIIVDISIGICVGPFRAYVGFERDFKHGK